MEIFPNSLVQNYLTKDQTKKLVRVEKRAFSIIGGRYISSSNYLTICELLKITNIEKRWTDLLISFGMKTLKMIGISIGWEIIKERGLTISVTAIGITKIKITLELLSVDLKGTVLLPYRH